MDTLSGLRARLKRLLDVSDVGARIVARDANLPSESHVGQVLRGDVVGPKTPTVEAIAVAFGVSPGWLAFGEGDGPTDEQIVEAGHAIRRRDHERKARSEAAAQEPEARDSHPAVG